MSRLILWLCHFHLLLLLKQEEDRLLCCRNIPISEIKLAILF